MPSPLPSDDADPAAAGVHLAVAGPVATVTLDRAGVHNAQTPATWRALAQVGADLPAEVRIVVVTGAGPNFSAGLDLAMLHPASTTATGGQGESLADLLVLDDDALAATIEGYQQGFAWLADPRYISIAAVRGHAIGAGFQLALACDLRVLADDAVLCMKESALGLVPDLTGTQHLVDCVGYARALELCVTARQVTAPEAYDLGLAHRVVPGEQLSDAVANLASALCQPDQQVAIEIKALLLGAGRRPTADQHAWERRAQVRRLRQLSGALGHPGGGS